MHSRVAFTGLYMALICLCPPQAWALCSTQWFEGMWHCKSPGKYDLRIEHDGASECSLSAVMQSPFGEPVQMGLIASDATSFAVGDEGGATVRLSKYSDGSFARGAFTIDGVADPIYCGRLPNIYVPLRGVLEHGHIRDMTHFLLLRAYP